MSQSGDATLLLRLRERYLTGPDSVGYEFWASGRPLRKVTYGELLESAFALSRSFLTVDEPQSKPVILMYPPGPDYLIAFFGCLLARRPVIPAYPPTVWNREIGLRRLRSMIADAAATTLLCSQSVLQSVGQASVGLCDQVLALEPWPRTPPSDLSDVTASGADVAVVQYTSGSTSDPKGAVITHANLEANLAAIQRTFGLGRSTRAVLWLPPYHDMGLVGGLLAPLYVGFSIRLMSPWEFLKNPISWLFNIADFGADASGGPNFAYEMCTRRVTDDQIARLDLSSWGLAFNGGDRIFHTTMERFTARFAATGFRPSAWLPCYGLAESTVLASAARWNGATFVRGASQFVSCGRPIEDGDASVLVASPELLEPVTAGDEGEVWLAGRSVSPGYWRHPEQTAEAFVERDGRRYVRTGDLGFRSGEELVITGRLKDVIVRNGVNVSAADVEHAAIGVGPELRPVAAAFSVERRERSDAVLVVESARRGADAETADLAARIGAAVLRATGVAMDDVVVTRPGAIPRTSSGKVQRSACRERYLAGDYGVRARATGSPPAGESSPAAAESPVTALLAGLVCGVFAAVCGVERCAPTTTLYLLGADSIKAAEIAAVLESGLSVPVSPEVVLEALTPQGLAVAIVGRCAATAGGLGDLESRLDRMLAGSGA